MLLGETYGGAWHVWIESLLTLFHRHAEGGGTVGAMNPSTVFHHPHRGRA